MAIYDQDGQCIEANNAVGKFIGTSREHFLNQNYHHIESWKTSGLLEAAKKAISSGETKTIEIHLQSSFGKTFIGNVNFIHITIEDKKFLLLTMDSLAEQKKVEEELRRKNRFIDKIIESSALSTWISDDQGTAIRTNPACLEFFGATQEEVIGKYNLFKDEVIERQGFMPEIRRVFEKGEVASFIIDYDFGAVGHIQARAATHKVIKSILTPVLDDKKKVTNVIVQAIDLTDIRKKEVALLNERDRVKRILEGTNAGTWTWNVQTGELIIDERWAGLIGRTLEELTPANYETWAKVVHPDDLPAVKKQLERIFARELDNYDVEFRAMHKSGDWIWVNARGKVTEWAQDGNPLYMSGTHLDITDRKTAEEEKNSLEAQLFQIQKMEAVGTLAGGIAHNFNNILMGIQGYTSLLKMNKSPSHPDFEYLNNVEKSVCSAAGLTKQLLGFAREGRYEVKPINLNDLIKNENEMFGQAKREIGIQSKLQPDLWLIEADKGQIKQVLLNLYVNAWQAMPQGGTILVQTENLLIKRDTKLQSDIEPGRYIKLSVTDTGIGMDSKTRKKVFDPFFTTKKSGSGSGLGLASAYGIIRNHSGYIGVNSEIGRGTTFDIYLPATDKDINLEEQPSKNLIKGEGLILLVDDEPMIGQVGKELLLNLNYEVLVAQNGEDAIAMYLKDKDRIRLVILDMIMPGMGGEEVFSRLRKIDPEVPVLLSSGYSLNEQTEELLKKGCLGFLQKPFNMFELSEKLKNIILED